MLFNCFQHEGHEPGVELLQEDEHERGVASWAASFEKLLGDPAGLHTFAVSGKAVSIYIGQALHMCRY
jgi:hypothetical protein